MLKKLNIKNFQSHKNTEIELSSAVNTIQGNSDCGKSAVMRALNWLAFNPAGDYFISDWAKRGKTISNPCEVTVEVDGHTITRKRDKDFNGYILDGQIFEATRNTVPPQVAEVLGLGEVNIQRQLDPPFLLSKSSGDVSRYINSLVNLIRIDEWTTAANGRTRRLQQDSEKEFERTQEAKKIVDSYSYLPRLEELSEIISKDEERIAELKLEIRNGLESLGNYQGNLNFVNSLPDINKVYNLLIEIKKQGELISETAKAAEILYREVNNHDFSRLEIERLPDFGRVDVLLDEISKIEVFKNSLKKDFEELKLSVDSRASVSVQNVPENFFQEISSIGRMISVKNNLEKMYGELKKEFEIHLKSSVDEKEARLDYDAVEYQLSTMVCPLCGRRGIHEEYK